MLSGKLNPRFGVTNKRIMCLWAVHIRKGV